MLIPIKLEVNNSEKLDRYVNMSSQISINLKLEDRLANCLHRHRECLRNVKDNIK